MRSGASGTLGIWVLLSFMIDGMRCLVFISDWNDLFRQILSWLVFGQKYSINLQSNNLILIIMPLKQTIKPTSFTPIKMVKSNETMVHPRTRLPYKTFAMTIGTFAIFIGNTAMTMGNFAIFMGNTAMTIGNFAIFMGNIAMTMGIFRMTMANIAILIGNTAMTMKNIGNLLPKQLMTVQINPTIQPSCLSLLSK